VGRIRERIEIAAPVARIWTVVHEDIPNVPLWSEHLLRTEVVGGGNVRLDTELRYVVKLPAGRTQQLSLVVTEYELHRRCAGIMEGGPMKGTWSWTYGTRGRLTSVLYESTIRLGGTLRFVGGWIEHQAASDVRRNLEGLKEYVESDAVSR
jgi:hypothetical protein